MQNISFGRHILKDSHEYENLHINSFLYILLIYLILF